ncbi:transporter [Chryseobacterium zhengzhouense]|uniref:Transporter n=1 Tax=Chryseobacterium zhengzhouense TaxID=1636086 RepID=A0ABW2LRZ0_9FLAO
MKNNHHYNLLMICNVLLISSFCYSQKKQEHKYSLFNPVPRELMREMETDRPDVTESPYTVDAGHFQYETDIIGLTREKSDFKNTKTLLINQANLKIGLTGSTAIQIGFETYGWQKEKDLNTGITESKHGVGDLNIRIKQNIIGNNKGNFALAILPYVKIPTSQYEDDDLVEGGLIVPMIYKFSGEWKLGFQVEVDRLKDTDEHAMHTELLQTLTISHPLSKNIEGIAETYYTYDFKAHEIYNFINAAVQMEVAKNFKIDAGLNYGIQHHAEKHYFLGASYMY